MCPIASVLCRAGKNGTMLNLCGLLRAVVMIAVAVTLCISSWAAVPAPWRLAGNSPAEYEAATDSTMLYNGSPSTYLKARKPGLCGDSKVCDNFGALIQTLKPESYAGKRIRLRANIKVENVKHWAGLWLRIDKGKNAVAFDNMGSRPIKGSREWKRYEVVLDVPSDATAIAFGVLLSGSGALWVNNVNLETVGPDVKVTVPQEPDQQLPYIMRPFDHLWGDNHRP